MMLVRMTLRVLFLATFLGASMVCAAEDGQFVAFVEDRLEPAARVAFQKTSSGWKSYCAPEQRILTPESCRPSGDNLPKHWMVLYRGEVKGSVDTSVYHPRFFADVGLFDIDDPESVPTVGEESRQFSGQIAHSGYRPLVAVSKPQYADPQEWTALSPAEVDIQSLWRRFKEAAGPGSTCTVDAEGEEKSIAWDYQMKNVKVTEAYVAKRSSARLVGLQLDPALNTCDGPIQRQWSTFWFHIDPKSHVKPLEFAIRNSATNHGYVAKVLDWGDYDGDGESEAVFWIESNNEDGYALFYQGFSREATFSWIYH